MHPVKGFFSFLADKTIPSSGQKGQICPLGGYPALSHFSLVLFVCFTVISPFKGLVRDFSSCQARWEECVCSFSSLTCLHFFGDLHSHCSLSHRGSAHIPDLDAPVQVPQTFRHYLFKRATCRPFAPESHTELYVVSRPH